MAKPSLADRLKGKGLDIEGTFADAQLLSSSFSFSSSSISSLTTPALPRQGAASSGKPKSAQSRSAPSAGPAPLSSSSKLMQELFTPLANQGASVMKKEKIRKAETEDGVTKNVLDTLRKWVQVCLVSDEKRQAFLQKNMLKCRVQAQWSEGLNEKLKAMIGRYGGRIVADCEKENAPEAAAWLARNEKWLVGFDRRSFDAFVLAHPEVVEPSEERLRSCIERAVQSLDLDAMHVKDFNKQLEAFTATLLDRLGPLRKLTQERAQRIGLEVFQTEKAWRKKTRPAKTVVQSDEEKTCKIDAAADVAWAAAVLAPWGFAQGPNGEEPVLRAPWAVAGPVLRGLRAVVKMPDLKVLLRQTQIGKVVNSYRHSDSPEAAKLAKELVTSWKAAFAGEQGSSKRPHDSKAGEPPTKRPNLASVPGEA